MPELLAFLLGSTKKAGTGLNIQMRMTDIHHLDAVFRPDEFIQREGRGVRFGNTNENIGLAQLDDEGVLRRLYVPVGREQGQHDSDGAVEGHAGARTRRP